MTRPSLHSERGSILILVAVSSVVLLSVAALSIDASFMFDLQNKLSATADAAAKSAAFEVKRGNSANLVAFARGEVTRHQTGGLIPSGVTMDAHLCTAVGATCSAPYQFPGYVEVILDKTQPTFFAGILGRANLTPRVRAVAGTANPAACLITMDDLTIGNSVIDMHGCTVKVGGDLTGTNPNADILGPSTVTGGCSGGKAALCSDGTVQYPNAPAPVNPFAGLAAPTVAGPCVAPTIINPLPPGCYTSIPSSITSLQAGIFKVTGKITISSTLSATSGTLIYLTSTGSIEGNNNNTLEVTASNTITGYEGIAIYGDAGSFIDFKNHLTLRIKGAVAMAGSDFSDKNHLQIDDTGCTIMIFNSFETNNGNGQIFNNAQCASLFGKAKYNDVALAE